MKITQEADYALRICSALAKEESASSPQLAAALCIPPRFILKVLHKLSDAGIVRSTRGSGGGFSLAESADTITLRQIIEAVDGSIAIRHCLLNNDCNFQNNKNKCRFHAVFETVNSIIISRLDSLTISDIVNEDLQTEELVKRLYK